MSRQLNTACKQIFSLVVLLLWTTVATAQADPIKTLDGITSRVMQTLKKNHDKLKSDPSKVNNVVEHLIVPHVDFVEMSKWVAGKSAWRKASKSQQDAFAKELKTLVVKTYATALYKYTDEKIEFLPLRNFNGSATKRRIQVSSRVIRTHKEDLRVDYRLIPYQDTWKVYDMIVEGVSILKGLQAQFSDDIRKEGLGPVILKMKAHHSKEA